MATNVADEAVQTLNIVREQRIAAPAEIVWETLLAQLGPASDMPDGTPFPMVLEPWPGGRWFRDLGNKVGHFWAHVQVIKPPKLLELCGPLFMSYPAISHIAYRLTPSGQETVLGITHRAMGLIQPDHAEGVVMGWESELARVKQKAEMRAGVKR